MNFYIIIPAHNEASSISLTLDSLLKQTLLPKKIVVVNDNSTDNLEHPMMFRSAASPGSWGWPANMQLFVASSYHFCFWSAHKNTRLLSTSGSIFKNQNYLILVSLNSTCLRAIGSYFVLTIFSVNVRLFFFVT